MATLSREPHIGRNISRIRELLDVKQEALAFALGISQQAVSSAENNPAPDDAKIAQFAKALGVSEHAIRNFDSKNILEYFSADTERTAVDSKILFEKLFEAVERNNQLLAQIQNLYERLLQAEREKVRAQVPNSAYL